MYLITSEIIIIGWIVRLLASSLEVVKKGGQEHSRSGYLNNQNFHFIALKT